MNGTDNRLDDALSSPVAWKAFIKSKTYRERQTFTFNVTIRPHRQIDEKYDS